jgi:hypothetical protein
MHRGHLVFSLVLPILVQPASARAEEVILRDGRRLVGKVQFAENRLQFLPTGQANALALDQVHALQFPETFIPAAPGANAFQLTLPENQRLHGEFLALEEQQLQFRPPWGKVVAIPRTAVRALTQSSGYLLVFSEDFESDLSAWQASGPATLDDSQRLSGRKSLLLRNDATVELLLVPPLTSGRLAVSFHDDDKAGDGGGFVEVLFQKKGERGMRVVVRRGLHYRIEPPGVTGELGQPAGPGGWHRLVVEFSVTDARVLVDERVLWAGRLDAPGLPAREDNSRLSKVRLGCVAGKGARTDGIYFDDFTLARAVDDLRHQDADPLQDEVWLASGDQLLGHVVRADRRSVELEARFGKRAWSWSEVRGIYLRQGKKQEPTEPGRTRLWLRSPNGGEFDQVLGKVRALTDRYLALRHTLLGDLEIDRAWIRKVAAE